MSALNVTSTWTERSRYAAVSRSTLATTSDAAAPVAISATPARTARSTTAGRSRTSSRTSSPGGGWMKGKDFGTRRQVEEGTTLPRLKKSGVRGGVQQRRDLSVDPRLVATTARSTTARIEIMEAMAADAGSKPECLRGPPSERPDPAVPGGPAASSRASGGRRADRAPPIYS